jgi:hypothetical protein
MWGKDFTDALIIMIILSLLREENHGKDTTYFTGMQPAALGMLLREENHGKDTRSLSAYDPERDAG